MRALAYGIIGLIALACALIAWEASFAALVGLQTKSWELWHRFAHGHEIVLPAQVAYRQWASPVVQQLATKALLGGLIALALVTLGLAQVLESLGGARQPSGGARLATERDLRKAGLLNGRPGYSVFLGRFNGKDLRYSGASHIYVNGPTRAGKGVGFVLPNAIEWRGSLIGLDIKREMWDQIGAARAALGQDVFMFSPGSARTHCWNPLDLVSPWPERATDVANIAHSLIPLSQSGDPYWAETARGLFAGLLAYVLDAREPPIEGRTIKAALKMFSRGRPLVAELANILANEPGLNAFVQDKFRQHISREEKQRQSFESHIVTALEPWNNSLVDAATSRSDFKISELRRRPFTILIGTPVGNFAAVEAVVRLLVQQVHDVLLRNLPGLDEPHRLLLMLDEFFQFGRMPEIVDRAPLVAGYGFQIAVIAQGLTQLDVRYGKPTRDMLIGNMDVKLLIGVSDETTARYCAEELGKHYVRREGWGTSVGAGFGGSQGRATRTTQGRWELQPLMTSEAMRRLEATKAVLLVRGEYGAVIDKAHFFKEARFKRRVEASRGFAHRIAIPDVTDAEGGEIETVVPGAPGGFKHLVAKDRVVSEARALYLDASAFEAAFVQAMTETGNSATAELLNLLRIEPARFGELRATRKRIFAKAPSPEAATAALRQEVYSARRLLNDERAQMAPATGAAATPRAAAPVATAAIASSAPFFEPAIGDGATSNDSGSPESPAFRIGDDMLAQLHEVKGRSDITAEIVKSAATRADIDDAAKLGALVDALSVQAELFIDTPTPGDLAALTAAVEAETAEQ
ncbi:type IV secretory system conjugative DNA transfer family protein [Methylocystis sp. H62]|uniref:type IV secretory system conjugative DNA transfer family protein n=1 Tax=Methylocystis sp. H62 TaxID=2785789 RepID=UPI0018C2DE40|nr:type IV secretory system conjugative DNA transfer family protein [Methylocystis sp. H62]MBG0792716.1 type IV secretory system conjugative DNA transfer family protein [Methylocystis sp. H62]